MASANPDPKPAGPVYLDSASVVQDGASYRVRLTGCLDATWIRAYVTAWTGLKFFSRFHLDVDSRTVQFSLAESEPQRDLDSVLEILAAMLRLTTLGAGVVRPEIADPSVRRQRRNRLDPAAGLQLILPSPPPPSLDPPRATWQEKVEDLVDDDVDSLVAEDLIDA